MWDIKIHRMHCILYSAFIIDVGDWIFKSLKFK